MDLRRALLIAALCGSPAACASGEPPAAAPAPPAAAEGAEHIHGLGINPADRSLVIATHSGLFRAGEGEARARRVGDRRQDTMGFTIVGPDSFLGSGHPDLRDDLPPLLGLIRSADAGRSWQPVSLLGEADFHVLRARGREVYGVNSADGALLASADGGRSWQPRTPPGALLDLAVHPGGAGRLVAAAEDGLHASRDGGRRWRRLGARRTPGLLAWAAPDALFLVDGAGEVHRSADGGKTFERTGATGGQPAAFASDGSDLYVALHTNEVEVSSDGGRTWRTRVAG